MNRNVSKPLTLEMHDKLPLKRLIKLTVLQAMIIGFIFYLIAAYNGKPVLHIIPYTVLTMAGVLMVGFSDIATMVILSHNYSTRSRKFSFLRRMMTYLLSILIYLLLRPVFAYTSNKHWTFWDLGSLLAFIGSGIVMNTLITLLHDSVLLYEHKMTSELELSRLRASNAEAMNLALKQQIHPHFLFNALNTLKALYQKDTQIADDYIVHMANFLRASIYHHSANVSILKDEVNLLYDYLAMQRIRFGNALDCTITLSEETLNKYYLPSFSLQPLLENAFKHNNFTLEDPLRVVISQDGDRLVISNNLQKKVLKVNSTNYGLANLAERYRLWSGDQIIIQEEQNIFSISIKLLDHEHSNH